MPHNKALSKAKIALMAKADTTFFTTICFSLKCEFDSSIPTACTNGTYIKLNPDFFMSLDREEQVFLLVHESMHVAYIHMDRLQTRDQRIFNMAADYVINLQLVERGFKMPKEGLIDAQFKGMSTEQVYQYLLQNPPQEGDLPMEDLVPADAPGELVEAVNDILIRAAMQSKMANEKPGSIPQELEVFINSLTNPKLPWHQILMKYVNSTNKEDYSWQRPNRRFMPDMYLPSLYSESLGHIAVAVDTSGSVSGEEFTQFISELHSIIKSVKPKEITLIDFDTSIKEVHKVKSVQELSKIRFKGRGGTCVRDLINWVNAAKPTVTLVFTDGEFYNSSDTKLPLVWLIHNNKRFKSKYGKTIHYDI